jgi:hypothetical protein
MTGLRDEDAAVLEAVGKLCTARPRPSHLSDTPLSPTGRSTAASGGETFSPAQPDFAEEEISVTQLDDIVLQNSHQFYKWHGELEAARTSETEQKYRRYGEVLGGHLTTCNQLMHQVDSTLAYFDALQEQVSPFTSYFFCETWLA